MKINFRAMHPETPDSELEEHAVWLLSEPHDIYLPGIIGRVGPPQEFKDYTTVDVLGKEFAWMNETFSKDKFEWYLWYESVFLVPEEMLSFLYLRWE